MVVDQSEEGISTTQYTLHYTVRCLLEKISTLGGAVVVEEMFDAMDRRKNDFAFLDEVEQGPGLGKGQGLGRSGDDSVTGNRLRKAFGNSSITGSSGDRQNNVSDSALGSNNSKSNSKNSSRSSSSSSGGSTFLTLQNTSAAYQVTPLPFLPLLHICMS